MTEAQSAELPPVTELTAAQRRVLGVLVEKAFTTPEAYPLTLKALTAGCNQKSNRQPVTSYSEDDVAETLHELHGMGLAAEVHTASGRTPRYRHYMRQRFPFTEPQLAVITELLLRGRQTLGELRSRAGRMVAIDNLETLRRELHGLIERKYAQASGPLGRRGVEVDHSFYKPSEGRGMRVAAETHEAPAVAAESTASPHPPPLMEEVNTLKSELQELRTQNRELREELSEIRDQLQRLFAQYDELRRDLGG